jgi:hypothetical protein
MKFKKVFILACVLLGLSTYSLAQGDYHYGLKISPAHGTFLDIQAFDIAVTLPLGFDPSLLSAKSPYQLFVMLNGRDVTDWFTKCIDQYTSPQTGENFLLCRIRDASIFSPTMNELSIGLMMGGEVIHKGSAHYSIVQTKKIYKPLPHSLTLDGKSIHKESAIQLTAGQSVRISASGQVNVWPTKIGFPIATPKGNSLSCNYEHCTLPGAPLGALLAKIGSDGHWVLIGENRLFNAYRTGEIIFGINDQKTPETLNDNIGSYEISVSRY